MQWEYEVEQVGENDFRVTYFGNNGRVIPSEIPFETEEDASIMAEDYINNIDDILSEEWQ